ADEGVAIFAKLAPPNQRDIGQRSIIIKARNGIAPLLGNAAFQLRGQSVRSIRNGNGTSLPVDVRFRCDPGLICGWDRRGRQKPGPLTVNSKSIPNGSYAKRLLCLFERFRMLNFLTFT